MYYVSLKLPVLFIFGIYLYCETSIAGTTTSSTLTASAFLLLHQENPSIASTKRRFVTSPQITTTMNSWSNWMTSWWSSPERPGNTPPQKPSTNLKYTNNKKNLIKKVTFVRHGCTYMNEYLAGKDGGKRFASFDFTDVFTTVEQQQKYHDTPLSPFGQEQAKTLGSYPIPPTFTHNCDLVVVSPLTRALQTFDLGIKPYLQTSDDIMNNAKTTSTSTNSIAIPIIALPYAAERLYLISDVGRPTREVQKEFPYVDFRSEFESPMSSGIDADAWWYQAPNDGSYEEWRPTGQQQKYACPAEPYDTFNVRMSRFYYWLQNRSEMNIIVVCHHGVIDWMLDMSFANCQYKQLPFTSIKPRTLIRIDEMEPVQAARL